MFIDGDSKRYLASDAFGVGVFPIDIKFACFFSFDSDDIVFLFYDSERSGEDGLNIGRLVSLWGDEIMIMIVEYGDFNGFSFLNIIFVSVYSNLIALNDSELEIPALAIIHFSI